MQKLFRSLIAIGGLAGLVACGDDVSITPPPPPDLVISGAPVTAIQVGAKVQLSANQAVSWTSSAAGVASVDGTGLVTAVSAGVASITATSTADPNQKASVTITVSALVNAAISVQNITVTGTPGNTVNVNNVAGSIDVNLNVVPGDQVVQRVEVLIEPGGPAVDCTQNLSGAQAAVSAEADVAAAEGVIVSCQINTAAFNTTTGAPDYLNGSHTLSARAIIVGGQQVATPSTPLIFNNANTYLATLTLGGTTASATGSDGLGYKRGSLTVAVVPVIYTAGGVTLASGSVTFGSAACDASPTNSARTATLTALTATFAQTGTAGTGNVVDYEYERGTCTAPETVTLNATDSQGNPLFTAAAPSSASTPGIRLDNRAPAAPVVLENVNSRAGGWVNDAASFNTVQASSNLNGMISAAVTDLGVNTVTYAARGAVTTSVATAAGGADITNASTFAPSLANAVCVVFFAQDALGNRSSAGTGTCDSGDADNNTLIGVDRAAPLVAYDASSVASNARINSASIAGEFAIVAADTGTAGVGVSGVVAPKGTVTRRDSVNTAFCQWGSGSSCSQLALVATATPGVYETNIDAITVSGYYTFNATAFDAAGNSTAVATPRVIVHDAIAPALSPAQVSLANNFYNGGVSQTFSAFANDNFDVWKTEYEIQYPALPDIFYGTSVLNTFNATPLLNTNVPAAFTVPFFYRQMQLASGGACPGTPVTVSAQSKPTNIVGFLFDQGNNSTGAVNTPIPAASVVTGSATAYPGTMCGWTVAASATTIGDGTGSTTPTSVTVSADALGPTLSFNPVFSRVDFYYLDAGRLTLIGTATTPATTDPNSLGFRQHRYSITWTPGTAFTSGGFLFAIGSTATGDALATASAAAITIQP